MIPPCFWLTGLSGSGKTTLATILKEYLKTCGTESKVLDGDELRKGICSNLGFSDEDRTENVRRVSHICNILAECNIIPIAALISPKQVYRDEAKKIYKGKFIEVYISCPIETCQKRDPKGLYAKVNTGEIKNFTGISALYEPPQNPDIIIHTKDAKISTCAEQLLEYWKKLCL